MSCSHRGAKRRALTAVAISFLFVGVAFSADDSADLIQEGLAHIHQGAYRQAADAFRQAAELEPESARPYVYMGLAYHLAGSEVASTIAFARAAHRDPAFAHLVEQVPRAGSSFAIRTDRLRIVCIRSAL